jgi:hypothetical protein
MELRGILGVGKGYMSTVGEPGQSFDAVCGISADSVDAVWPAIEDMVAEALEHSRGEISVEDVRMFLLARVMQLWISYDAKRRITACMVTQIIDYPRRRFLRIVLIAGVGHEFWQHGWELVELWARDQQCSGVESFARRGLARMFKSLGFREEYSVVGFDFTPTKVH